MGKWLAGALLGLGLLGFLSSQPEKGPSARSRSLYTAPAAYAVPKRSPPTPAEKRSYSGLVSESTSGPQTVYVPPTPAPKLESKAYVAENGSYYGETSKFTNLPKTVYVHGYTRKDETYVRSHYRSHR